VTFIHSITTEGHPTYVMPHMWTKFGEHAFSYAAWNSSPKELKSWSNF